MCEIDGDDTRPVHSYFSPGLACERGHLHWFAVVRWRYHLTRIAVVDTCFQHSVQVREPDPGSEVLFLFFFSPLSAFHGQAGPPFLSEHWVPLCEFLSPPVPLLRLTLRRQGETVVPEFFVFVLWDTLWLLRFSAPLTVDPGLFAQGVLPTTPCLEAKPGLLPWYPSQILPLHQCLFILLGYRQRFLAPRMASSVWSCNPPHLPPLLPFCRQHNWVSSWGIVDQLSFFLSSAVVWFCESQTEASGACGQGQCQMCLGVRTSRSDRRAHPSLPPLLPSPAVNSSSLFSSRKLSTN